MTDLAEMNDVSWATDDAKAGLVDIGADEAMSEQTPTEQEFARLLGRAIDRGDRSMADELLEVLLDVDRAPLPVFNRILKAMGGRTFAAERIRAFLGDHGDMRRDLEGVLTGKGTVLERFERRLDFDQHVDGIDSIDMFEIGAELTSIARKNATLGLTAAVAGPLGPAILAKAAYDEIMPFLDEVAETAWKFWDELANEMADSDLLIFATYASLVRDVFAPKSGFELVMSLMPWGRFGFLFKAVLQRAAIVVGALLARRGLPRIARAVMDFVGGFIRDHVTPLLSSGFNRLADGMVGALGKQSRAEFIAAATSVLRTMARGPLARGPMDDAIAVRVAGTKLTKVAARELQQLAEALTLHFNAPKGVLFEVLPDGSVVQTITKVLRANGAGRAHPNLVGLAGTRGLVNPAGLDWGHIISSIRSGDDAMYNLVRMDARINRSYVSMLFDELPTGLRVEARVLFDSVEDCVERAASKMDFHAVSASGSTRQYIDGLTDLMGRPDITLNALGKRAMQAAAKLRPADFDNETLSLYNVLVRFFE